MFRGSFNNIVALAILGVALLISSAIGYFSETPVAAGVVLAVAIISYYKALELGPISSVVPIYGMYIALSSLIGFLVMGERLTPAKSLGLLCALLAILLLSR